MSGNPFAEPEDTERTVIHPPPGGRKPSAPLAGKAVPTPSISAPPLLDPLHHCLSLGRDRLRQRGAAGLEALRRKLHGVLLRRHPAREREVSPYWQGIDMQDRPARAAIAVWAMAACVLAALSGLSLGLSATLKRAADAVVAVAASVPPTIPPIEPSPPVRAPPPQPERASAAVQLRRALQPEITAGLVTVSETAAATRVQVRNTGLFTSGSATVQPGLLSLLERIGQALNTEPGQVRVIGHADNQPIRTRQFPSNVKLSTARAEAARAVIGRTVQDPARLSAEGRAALEPIAGNDTAEGRAANRRIEIVLDRQD